MKKKPQLGYRIMAEYGSSGIWRIGKVGVFRHAMVEHSSLRLPRELRDRFCKWVERYDECLSENGLQDIDGFNAEGLALAKELKKFLGSAVYVEYHFDGLADAIPIEEADSQSTKAKPKDEGTT